jgi:uncharacterized membrane protein
MAGADDEWPILADPKPDDEGWPLQPNNAPGPPPTELRPADQPFPTYQSKPDSLASQVQCIAGITCVCLAVLTLISAAIGFFLPSHTILQITMIVLMVGLTLCVIAAAVAEPFVNRQEATDMEPRRAR